MAGPAVERVHVNSMGHLQILFGSTSIFAWSARSNRVTEFKREVVPCEFLDMW